MTIEGAPYLAPSTTRCSTARTAAARPASGYLAPMSHVKMMAAAQPFLSGAISKTVNLPNDATVEDVREIYEEGWRLGLKAVALYRDGCKASQPLSHVEQGEQGRRHERAVGKARARAARALADPRPRLSQVGARLTRRRASDGHARAPAEEARRLHAGSARRRAQDLPPHRRVRGRHARRDLHRHAQGGRGLPLADELLRDGVSIGLQYGVPLETYVEQFTFTRFEPQGVVEGHPNMKFATSIVDYLFRVLGVEYLHRYDFAHVKPTAASAATEVDPRIAADHRSSRPPMQAAPRAEPRRHGSSARAHRSRTHVRAMDAGLASRSTRSSKR